MKGKGKATSQAQDNQEKDKDVKDCPLQFPDLCAVDHIKDCARYTQVLNRDDQGHVSIEELDQIQADIEILLASVGKRLKLLGSENHTLATWPDKKDVKKSNGKGNEAPSQCSTPTKRKGTPVEDKEKDGKSSKKFKDSNGRSSQPSTPTHGGRSKGKNSQSKGQPDDSLMTSDPGTAVTHTPITDHHPKVYNRKDAVNRFWASVEPYCAPISADDLKVVEEMLAAYEQDTDMYRIPPLGIHYTQRWAQEDLAEEQADGCKINDKKKPNGINGSTATDAANILKKAETKKNDYYMDDSPFGPLTQRLVSALIEDNLMAPVDDAMQDSAECADEAPAMSPKMLAKQLNIGNPASLERRIRKELEEQGIIEKEEADEEQEEDDPEDEVLSELRRKQQELKAVCQQNVHILRSLHRQGREDLARQGLKKKLQACDAEIMEAYRKVQIARQKKKSPTKKDKEIIAKALKEREAIVKALEL